MKVLLFLLIFGLTFFANAQGISDKIKIAKHDSSLIFTGTRAIERDDSYDSTGHFILGAYVSAYYAAYSDTSGPDGFQKFPTVAPRNESFGLNIAMISMKYRSEKFRANSIFHFGDIPLSAWSPKMNAIQEANLGFRVVKNLWLDAGLFRTHIGLESIQPRENIAMSIAVATYYEPYYLGGAKLSYLGFSKLTLQVNVFNSFNGFIETNNSKAYGASVGYEFNSKFNVTYNFITCDESAVGDGTHQRFYNNLIGSYKSNSWLFGFDFNYGSQKNSGLIDSTKTTEIFSALLAAKYNFFNNYSVYTRASYFQDRDEMLTGPIENENHKLVGLDLLGVTLGLEYRPIPNSYVRLESRLLQTTSNETVFSPFQGDHHKRLEGLFGIGVWF